MPALVDGGNMIASMTASDSTAPPIMAILRDLMRSEIHPQIGDPIMVPMKIIPTIPVNVASERLGFTKLRYLVPQTAPSRSTDRFSVPMYSPASQFCLFAAAAASPAATDKFSSAVASSLYPSGKSLSSIAASARIATPRAPLISMVVLPPTAVRRANIGVPETQPPNTAKVTSSPATSANWLDGNHPRRYHWGI